MTVKLWGDKYPTKASGSEEDLLGDDLNDTYELLVNTAILTAENAVRVLQANNIYINGPNIIVDEFTDADGTQGTVNTGSSTAYYNSNSDEYALTLTNASGSDTPSTTGTWTNINNAFDDNYLTEATMPNESGDYSIGTIFTSKHIGYLYINFDTIVNTPCLINLQTYNGSTWDDVEILTVPLTGLAISKYYNINASVEGVRLLFKPVGYMGASVYQISYGTFTSGQTLIADTNTTILDGNELGFAVSVPDSNIPTDTSIDVVVSDGVNSTPSQTIDSISKGVVVGNSNLTSGTLKVTFILNTTDTSKTATIPSIGICVLR